MQYVPCERAVVRIAGRPVPGRPRIVQNSAGRPSSSASTTIHEAWSL